MKKKKRIFYVVLALLLVETLASMSIQATYRSEQMRMLETLGSEFFQNEEKARKWLGDDSLQGKNRILKLIFPIGFLFFQRNQITEIKIIEISKQFSAKERTTEDAEAFVERVFKLVFFPL